MPFLYLPDAISLTMLLLLMTLLRRSAVAHVQQELLGIRNELLLYCFQERLPLAHPACVSLRHQIDDSLKVTTKQTAAVLSRMKARAHTSESYEGNLSAELQTLPGSRAKENLRRLELESNLALGVFLLLGSVAGWILLLRITLKIAPRLFKHRSGDRIDWLFDLSEKLLSRLARTARCSKSLSVDL